MRELSASFLVISSTGEVNKDAAHQAGRKRVEMNTVLPINILNVDKPKVDLVNQGRGLKRVPRLLGGHISLSEPMELPIDQGHELMECLLIP